MDITESLLKATTLLGLGMTFVFLFLGFLMVFVKLMAKYIPADKPVINKKAVQKETAGATSELNPKLIAAITTAVQQYRKIETV
jgi:oxaloacetate decarboxylase gamma subunit